MVRQQAGGGGSYRDVGMSEWSMLPIHMPEQVPSYTLESKGASTSPNVSNALAAVRCGACISVKRVEA